MKESLKDKNHNPIDRDKITETPHLLPYAHSVGSAIIKPLDKGKIKGLGMAAMYEQTDVLSLTVKSIFSPYFLYKPLYLLTFWFRLKKLW
jgi:hypothetical protein